MKNKIYTYFKKKLRQNRIYNKDYSNNKKN